MITIPIIEYINKAAGWQCSYPKSVYPSQQMFNPYVHPNGDDCGNGKDLRIKLHVYAGQRSQDKAVTVVIVNKTSADITSALALSNHQPKGDLQMYLFSSAAPTSVVAKPSIPVTTVERIVITYPAASATLLVVP